MTKTIAYAGIQLLAEHGIQFHASENLAWGVLAEETEIQGLRCAAGEEIEFHPDGRLAGASLALPATIHGLAARGSSPVAFYPNGNLRFLSLARPRRIGGFPAGPGNTFFHPDGQVWSGVCFAELQAGTSCLPAGTRLTLASDGRVLEWWRSLEVDTDIQGIPCSARFPVWFYASGTLSCLHLSRSCRVDGNRLSAETEVILEPDGSLRTSTFRRYPRGSQVPWRIFGAIEEPMYD
jgi:hypothetical protein